MSEEARPRPRAEAIIAKGKASAMIIGALATAGTAVWGAVRQPPEPGAKIAYEILREALQQERVHHEKLEDEIDVLKARLNSCSTCERSSMLLRRPSADLEKQSIEVNPPMVPAEASAAPRTNPHGLKPLQPLPVLPHASELGL